MSRGFPCREAHAPAGAVHRRPGQLLEAVVIGWLRRICGQRSTAEPVEAEPEPVLMTPTAEARQWTRDAYEVGKAFGYRLAVQELSEAVEAAKKLDLDFSKTDPFNRLTTRGRA